MPASRPAILAIALLAAALAAPAVPVAAVAAGPAPAPATATAPAAAREKGIFAVSDADPAKWNLTLGNLANALQALGRDGADLELVAYGPGIAMLKKDSPVADKLAAALRDGVRVAACANSMKANGLAPDALVPGVQVVPSGVVELMRQQHRGYAYVRS